MLKVFWGDFKKGFMSYQFVISVALVIFACMFSRNGLTRITPNIPSKTIFEELFYWGREALLIQRISAPDMFINCVVPYLALFLPVIAALPATLLFCDELQGFYKLEIFRVGKRAYISEKLLVSMALAASACFIGMMTVYAVLCTKFPTIHCYPKEEILTEYGMWSYYNMGKLIYIWNGLFFIILSALMISALAAVVSLVVSLVAVLIPNKFFAVGLPIVFFKIICNTVYSLYESPLKVIAPYIFNPERCISAQWDSYYMSMKMPWYRYPIVLIVYGVIFFAVCVRCFEKKCVKP